MSKTLTANPIAGLKGVPARIILDSNSLTVKTGLVGSGTTIPYRSIASVNFKRELSTTGSGSITITPFTSSPIKVIGFYKSQFDEVQRAVSAGGVNSNDADDDDDRSTGSKGGSVAGGLLGGAVGGGIMGLINSRRQSDDEIIRMEMEESKHQREQRDIANREITDIVVETKDPDRMAEVLNDLFTRFDADPGYAKKAIKSKYSLQLEYLKAIAPKHPLINLFEKKLSEMKIGIFNR